MRILLLQIDKTQDSYLEEGIGVYVKRLKNYTSLEVQTIIVPKSVRQKTFQEQKLEEARLLFNQILPDDSVVVLDEKGETLSSMEFSKFIAKKQNASTKRLVFIIGGPFGFDQAIYSRANFKLSLSKNDFFASDGAAFFVEQLYRAYSILKGEKYHHE